MSKTVYSDPEYIMGRSTEETHRLQKQANLYDSATRQLFQNAGIKPGMKVLDVGSGAGDVALLAGELVGPTGVVIGVDNNGDILHTARERARAAGLSQVSFVKGDVRTISLDHDFDAIVGRLVLMYMADAVTTLAGLVKHLRPDGIVAFQEIDWTSGPLAATPFPALNPGVAVGYADVFSGRIAY